MDQVTIDTLHELMEITSQQVLDNGVKDEDSKEFFERMARATAEWIVDHPEYTNGDEMATLLTTVYAIIKLIEPYLNVIYRDKKKDQ